MNLDNNIGILYVDDESKALKYFKDSFEDLGPIFTAESGEEGLVVFRENRAKIGIVLSDKMMPGMSGLEFLAKIRRIDDLPLRMLVTANNDLVEAVEALNEGLLYSYMNKPWSSEDLETKLKRAMDRYWISRERKRLLKDRAATFQEMMMAERASSFEALSLGLNHHMRNSLTVIQSFFDMIPLQLEQEVGGAPRDRFFWEDYYNNVEDRLSSLISILTNLTEGTNAARVSSDDAGLEPIQLREVIESVVEKHAIEDATISFKGQPEVTMEGEGERIVHLIETVVLEASKNIKNGGSITLEVEPCTVGVAEAEGVEIRCIDNGDLLPEPVRRHLFDPFHIRSDRPSELSTDLLSAYITVYTHGGTIRADRTEENCNLIEITLPLEAGSKAGLGDAQRIIGGLK